MTMDQWKALKVVQFLDAIGNTVPYDVAGQWMAEHNYNATIAVANWKALY